MYNGLPDIPAGRYTFKPLTAKLPRRPGKRPARKQMEVDVKHRLSGSDTIVLYNPEAALFKTFLADNFSSSTENMTNKNFVQRSQVQTIDEMFFGDQQQMQRRLGRDVLDHQELVVFEHLP